MSNLNLEQLVTKAGEMAISNKWGEKAYKINMAILKLDQNNCAACTRLAKYYKLNDNVDEAKNMYLRALDIDPQNRGAINNLLEIERDQKENDQIDKIVSIGELVKEGQKCMAKGKYKLASKLFLKAYNTDNLLSYAVNLARAYKEMGKYEDIEKLYLQLIDLKQSASEIQSIDEEFVSLRAI